VRPFGRGAIDGSDVLGIAQRAIDRRPIDGDLRAGAFLPALESMSQLRQLRSNDSQYR
jgi:hypothetical protein